MSLVDFDGLVVDDETGEVVECAEGEDRLAMVTRRRHDAYVQSKEWEKRRMILDQVLLKGQADKSVTYGDVVCRVAGGSYLKTNSEAFADMVYERFGAAFRKDAHTGSDCEPGACTCGYADVGMILAVIAAGTAFKRDLLPEDAQPLYDSVTERIEKKPWIETAPVLRRVP